MLLDTLRGLSVLRAVRDALPSAVLTTSLRRGYDDSTESAERFFQLVDEAFALGFAAVRVHGRTVEQKYNGKSRWPFLRQVKSRYPNRTILGAGDVFTAEGAVQMLRETAVDIVWIARGAIGNPWIFQHAAALMGSGFRVQGSESSTTTDFAAAPSSLNPEPRTLSLRNPDSSGPNPPSIHQQRDALAEHFAIAMEIHGEQLAGRRMRKMGIKYARFHPRAAEVKAQFINVRSLRDWTSVLTNWYTTDAPGVWPAPDAVDEVNPDASCAA
jgi:tRNA-dihydrouridine synthase